MKSTLIKFIEGSFRLLGYNPPRKMLPRQGFPVELSEHDYNFFQYIKKNNLSMSSNERLFATMLACNHVIANRIGGDFVECGVWRGGHSILAGLIFKHNKCDKSIYLFDTFLGMTKPTDLDINALDGVSSIREFTKNEAEGFNNWCYASIEDVKKNVINADISNLNCVYVKGDVLKTLKERDNLPKSISILRLDTDWYESTRIELEVLYPLLTPGGVIIIDDYGHWSGARSAVDEFFSKQAIKPLFNYIDYTGRIGIKPHNT